MVGGVVGWRVGGGGRNLKHEVSAPEPIWNVLPSAVPPPLLLRCFPGECREPGCMIQNDRDREWEERLFLHVSLACVLALTAF